MRKSTLLLFTALLAPLHLYAQAELPPVTSASGNPRLPGKFIWADLVTDDVAAARQFYFELFHWKFDETGEYTIAFNDDRPLCGIFHRPRPKDHPEAKPRWFGYISVPNVSRARRAVTEAGGRILVEPKKVGKRGEQAICADAEGALFGILKSSGGDPEDFLASEGDWIWIQLLSHDAKKASAFYHSVAGYEVVENTAQNRLNDYVLTSKGYARATVRTIPNADVKVQPCWLPFVRVANVQQISQKAEQLGGKILIQPKPEVLDGKVAVIADPTGAAIGILEWQAGIMKRARQMKIAFAFRKYACRAAVASLILASFSACQTDELGTGTVYGAGYNGTGFGDPWYYGSYYNDSDIIVSPPSGPDNSPRPSHPIANVPSAPRPTPMPSAPRASPRGR